MTSKPIRWYAMPMSVLVFPVMLAISATPIFGSPLQDESSPDELVQAAGELAEGETAFPKIVGANIPGAPKLAQPFIVMGSTKPVMTEKHGLAAPALHDWNGDGKKDLLVGEFETGDDESNIRVYLNIGSDDNPRFNDEFEYAKDTSGNVLSVPQW